MTMLRSSVRGARAALVIGLLGAATETAARAEVAVGSLVGDHMVVQQGRPVPLSGTAAPGESVTATLGAVTAATKADAGGRWSVSLPARTAGGPFTLVIAGTNRLVFGDVWVGEVWLGAGQSNMEFGLNRSNGGAEAVARGCSGLHLFTVARASASAPKHEVGGKWRACDAEAAANFSAVAFHFGRELHRTLGVPVGLITASYGGTPAESWTPREALLGEPSLRGHVERLDEAMNDPARRADALRALAAWEAKAFPQDTGNRGEKLGFAKPSGGAGWIKMDLPRLWEDAGLPIDGVVWFRREVVIPPDWAGGDLALSLGAIDDFDITYWNGERVGATGSDTPEYWSAPRRYTVPARLVKAGRNLIAVRVFDHFGSGGFAGAREDLTVASSRAPGHALSLAGPWTYKIERRLSPVVVDFGARPTPLGPENPTSPTVLWNGMIAPLAALPLAGVLWYQGESSASRAVEYRTLFPTLIRAWRGAWKDPKLPFIFVQLPGYDDPTVDKRPFGEGVWADLREAQALSLREPRTAMAVTLDLGEAHDIHPHEKHEVGRRAALWALKLAYDRPVLASGPTFVSATRAGSALHVRLANVASGLVTTDGAAPRGFAIAGADRAFHAAEARLDGDVVVVSSPAVPAPVAVRYGWGNDPANTLRNQADLPAAPFRSDDWPMTVAQPISTSAAK